jgi:phospholipid transport system substrate-binding protein
MENRMRFNQIFKYTLLLIMSFSLVSLSFAGTIAPEKDPIYLLEIISSNMIRELKNNKANLATKPKIVYQLAEQYVIPHANLDEMSKRVIPPQVWRQATPAQQAEFKRAFTTILIRTYASALTSYQDQTIKFYPLRGDFKHKSTVDVKGIISSSDNQAINVVYRLIRKKDIWTLYDLSVEGVSMLESFRDQFAEILSHGDMAELINRLTKHNSR